MTDRRLGWLTMMTFGRRVMLNRATALGAILVALSTALTAAEPLAVLECHEITGRDWGRTLVTYHLAGPGFKSASISDGKVGEALPPEGSPGRVRLKAAVKPGEVRLLDASAKEVPFQLSRVRLTQDGALVSARLSFYAELPASGSYHYELLPGKTTAPLSGTPGLEGRITGDALDHPGSTASAGRPADRRIRSGVRPDRHAAAVGAGGGEVPIP